MARSHLLAVNVAVTVSAAIVVGCAPDVVDPDIVDMRAPDPGPLDPALGFQFEGPEFTLQPGEERMLCWVPDSVRSGDMKIARFEGIQSEVGHHVVAMGSARPREPGSSFDCTNIAQMAELEPLVLPSPDGVSNFLPEGFFVRLKESSSIVLQSHYVNYTTDPIVVRDFARFYFADEAAELTEASYLIVNSASFRLDPGVGQVTVDCNIEGDDINVLATLGHMHELGRAFSFDRVSPSAETIYSVDTWTTDMRDTPPLTIYEPTAPLTLKGGDALRVTCDYDNTTDGPVGFPQEMCTSVSAYYPARPEGLILCD